MKTLTIHNTLRYKRGDYPIERISGFRITGNKEKESEYLVQSRGGVRPSWVPVNKIMKNRADILDFLNKEIDEVILEFLFCLFNMNLGFIKDFFIFLR